MVAFLGSCVVLLLAGVDAYSNDNGRHGVSSYATGDL